MRFGVRKMPRLNGYYLPDPDKPEPDFSILSRMELILRMYPDNFEDMAPT